MTRNTTRLFLAAGLLTLAPAWAHAQAAPPPPPPPPPQHETSAEVSFVGTSGNSSTNSIGVGGGRLDHLDGWILTEKIAYNRNSSDGLLRAESLTFAFQGSKTLTKELSVFGKHGFLHDRFAGVESRNSVAAGAAYILVQTAPHKLTVDGAFGYANEERTIAPSIHNATWDMGALYAWKLSSNAEVTDDVRVVFSLSDGQDWRSGNVAAVSAKLMTIFSLKFSNTVRYVNAPVPGFQKTDTITAVALVAKF